MVGVLSLLVIAGVSLLVTRVAAVALTHTGLSREAARFQARSAFTGVGFTTGESESIVAHPIRRRIVMWLMFVGNVGIVGAMSSLLLSLLQFREDTAPWIMVFLVTGIALLWFLASSAWVDRHLSRWISRALDRYTSVQARDYGQLLRLRQDYGVSELLVREGDWLAGKQLRHSELAEEGVVVLGVETADGAFVGAPGADHEIGAGDTLLVYGRTGRIAELDQRAAGRRGDRSHEDAVAEQERVEEAEEQAQQERVEEAEEQEQEERETP